MTDEPIPPPRGVCGVCFSAGIGQRASNGAFAIYCGHHHAGAFLGRGPEDRWLWQIFTPIGAKEFDTLKNVSVPANLLPGQSS